MKTSLIFLLFKMIAKGRFDQCRQTRIGLLSMEGFE